MPKKPRKKDTAEEIIRQARKARFPRYIILQGIYTILGVAESETTAVELALTIKHTDNTAGRIGIHESMPKGGNIGDIAIVPCSDDVFQKCMDGEEVCLRIRHGECIRLEDETEINN